MAAERGGYIQEGPAGMGSFVNLSCPTRPYNSVRFKLLGQIGQKIPAEYIGGSMTWAELSSVGVPWGNNENIIYSSLQPGWTYIYNPGRKTFTVTDASNNVTVHSGIASFSDLGIVWDIIESPQFKIVFDASFENNAFLIAWKYIHGRIPPGEEIPDFPWIPGGVIKDTQATILEYCWSLVDQYLSTGDIDPKIGRFVLAKDHEVVQDGTTATLSGTDISRTILLARVVDLSAYGSAPTNLFAGPGTATAEPDKSTKTGHIVDTGTLLMIASFASIMNMSKPVLEPWMLWKLWQWTGSSSVVIKRDRCFDLSPWWG